MNLCVIGTGYVGLVVGACLADSGNDVICVDSDSGKIEKLKQGIIPIYEPGLGDVISRNVIDGRLTFETETAPAVRSAQVVFIAVGTPTRDDGVALDAVFSVAQDIGKALNEYKVVVTKSTVPVGTTERVREIIRTHTDVPFDVASNPEFLKEGDAVADFMKPDRIVIGTDSEKAAGILSVLHAPYVRTGNPVYVMDIRSAEMTKYAANTLLATRISFMNELSMLCEEVGADIEAIRPALGADPRVGPAFLFAGVGFGGSCLPKDTRAAIHTGWRHGARLRILEAVVDVNVEQRRRFVRKVLKHFHDDVSGKRIAVWGLSFKPRTNDMRDAPSIEVIETLLARGADVRAHDPAAREEARQIFGERIQLPESNYGCLVDADALLLLTEWQAYRNPNFERMKSMMRQPVIFDGRNIYNPKHLRELGFVYHGVGRS